MNLLLIGNIASGKSSVAAALIRAGFAKENDYHSIDDFRTKFSDGTFAGEFYAWAKMLSVIQYPSPNGNGIYEFSGTGKNAWFARECIKFSQNKSKADWRAVYCSLKADVIKQRCVGREYNVPLPYKFGDIADSIKFIGDELSKNHGKHYWNCPEITISTDQFTPDQLAQQIISKL